MENVLKIEKKSFCRKYNVNVLFFIERYLFGLDYFWGIRKGKNVYVM